VSYSIVILSSRASNLVACVQSVLANEPDLPPERIVVVDDGARQEAEPLLPGVRWLAGLSPFVFARNANLGIQAADTDVILLNDDARLETPGGFTTLVGQVSRQERPGICSAAVRGMVGNPRQLAVAGPPTGPDGRPEFRIEPVTLAFVCVCIPRSVYANLGPLDERFCGYGFEDNDYCARALQAGLDLTIWDGCVVEHGSLPPTYRGRPDWRSLSNQSQALYVEKWRALAAEQAGRGERPFDLEYVAHNRLELTRETLRTLWRNTNWTLVRTLTLRDLGSEDGTAALLEAEAALMPVPTRVVRAATAATNGLAGLAHAARNGTQAGLIRVDAATMVAPGWLRQRPNPDDTRPELALPSFELDRLPYEPWASHADDYVQQGWQPVRPRYEPDAGLWRWRWPDLTPATASARPRFLGAMRIKDEARWLKEVLTRALDLCSEVYVLDDHSTDETPLICQSFGSRVRLFRSPFAGLNEARDKNYLLEKLIAARPDWVLWIDGDEVLEQQGAEMLRAAVADGAGDVAALRLRIAYLWDDRRQVRVDGLWGRFMRPSFFRLQGQPLDRLKFRSTDSGGNFHCGNIPLGLVGEVRPIEVRLKHYGYLSRRQRQAKYVWYNERDPNNEREDRYRHLAEIPGARHAPGPAVFVPWEE
jgi:hypothetical protein